MNVNLKISSKSIVYILRQVIPDLIHPDQKAYVKDKVIGEFVRVIEDILDHTDQENLDGILFVDDIERPLILLSIIYFFCTRKFGFGPDFSQWIKNTFCNSQSYVMNNGSSTGYLSLERGTR